MNEPQIDLGLGIIRCEQPQSQSASFGQFYAPRDGLARLRAVVAEWQGVAEGQVAVTTGASMGLVCSLATVDRPGTVLCPRPFFPAYPRMCQTLGLTAAYYDTLNVDPAKSLRESCRDDAKALILNCPSNPTGRTLSAEFVKSAIEIAKEQKLLVISDEVYADFVFEGGRPLATADWGDEVQIVRIKSASKSLCIPGERVGFVIASEALIDRITSVHWTLAMSPPATGQLLAFRSLTSGFEERIHTLRERLKQNRNLSFDILNGSEHLSVERCDAGIFHWIAVTNWSSKPHAFVKELAMATGVVVMPGQVFGIDSPLFVRVSFAVPSDELAVACERIVGFVARSSYSSTTK